LNKKDFWITNISNRNVCLRDLALTVKANSHANLLDSKHYHYTLEQLEKSVESGSIFRKQDKIKIRKVLPDHLQRRISVSTDPLDKVRKPLYSKVQIVEQKFDELIEPEEAQAEDIADIIAGLDEDQEDL
jgi:hypothetical protein